jgi:glycosyltransferase involved in cell wall biosynthesis
MTTSIRSNPIPRRILMIAYSHYETDGRLHRYSQSLIKRGDQVDVIGLARKNQSQESDIHGVHVYRINKREFNETSAFSYLFRLMLFFIKSFLTCTKLHIKNRYDLIHYHNIPDFGIFCTVVAKLMRCPVILDIHDMVPEFYMRKFDKNENMLTIRLLKKVEKISAHYADYVITVTDIWRDRLILRSVKPEKCLVIMNAPYHELFHPIQDNGEKPDAFKFIYHGNILETTGVDIAVRAAARALKIIPNLELTIIGEGRDRDEIASLIKELDIAENVKLCQSMPIEAIPKIIALSDVGIDPKLDGVYSGETLSVKAMEYLAMEKPTIVSRTPAAKYYFDESTVLFFQPGNVDELTNRMVEIARNPSKRQALIEGAKRFNQKYSFEAFQGYYFQLIDTLCRCR